MAEEPKKIFVDDDWKAEARREKEQLSQKVTAPAREAVPPASFDELLSLVAMHVMAHLGMMAGPGGRPMPPNLEMAKHFVDMLQVFEDKTKGNLSPDEKKKLDAVLYETRMHFVQVASAVTGRGM